MRIAVVGAGRVGTAVAVLLSRAGHEIAAVAGRTETAARVATWLPGVPFLPAIEAAALGEVVLLCVPDDALGPVAAELAAAGSVATGTWVAHVSGAAGLEVLEPLQRVGARRLALHPLQTFPDVEGALAALPGCHVAVTADDEDGLVLGERLAADLGAAPFRLADDRRPLYHTAAVFASNYLVATSGVAERLFAEAGVPEPLAAMRPLQEATLANVARLGPGAALTGPAARGDASTVERNLAALASRAPETAPETVAAYVAMCRVALDLAEPSGRLDPTDRRAVEAVLERWDR
jgi:predicted short-subunit dehydrogenase-like oxidoreductase (DUF2520 family)